MKIEVLVTLKGHFGEVIPKGSVFISPNIPRILMEEIGAGADTIRVTEDPPAPIETPIVEPVVVVDEVKPVSIPEKSGKLKKRIAR